jgi:hypothetical protein
VRRGRSPHGRGYLALTFSTLLSSQGASAHRIKGLSAGHRGNSLTLPGDLPPVKRSGFGSPGLPHTDTDRSDTNRADGGGSGHRRGTGHLDRCPFLPVRRTSRTLRRSTDPSQIDIRARRSRPLFRDSLSSWSKPAADFTNSFGSTTAANLSSQHPRQRTGCPGHSPLPGPSPRPPRRREARDDLVTGCRWTT